MRPGPGLVVMALAFISGARRGSSSGISSATATPTPTSTAAGDGGSRGAEGRGNDRGGGSARGEGSTTLPSTGESSSFVRSSGSYLLPIFLPHHLDLALQFGPRLPPGDYHHQQQQQHQHQHDHAHTESWISSRIADRRQRRRRRDSSSSSRDIAGRAGGTETVTGTGTVTGIVSSKGSGTAAVTAGTAESSEEEQEEDRDPGLPVQFPSSQAFDEDEDIFALVAEDDLLSEESFDRLIKLNEDADEEDYKQQPQPAEEAETEIDTETEPERENETETETETETEREAEADTETETEQQQQDESRLIDEGVLQHSDNSHSHSPESANSYDNNNNKREASGRILDAQTAQLIGHKDNSLSAVATTESAGASSSSSSTTTTLPAPVDLKKSILGTASSLTRLNPWISACDLAQPGTATDLQGQCSAGTLPMAWVDEGPGPPICPRSCAEQQHQKPAASKARPPRSASSNNKVKYFVNYKAAQMRLRRERDYAMDATESNSPMPASERPTTTDLGLDMDVDIDGYSSSTSSAASVTEETVGGGVPEPEPTLSYSHLHAQEQLQLDQDRGEDEQEQQQCLEYLGDSAESSPQHLCDLRSPGQLLERLRALRLRNCCERSVFSALHTLALNASLSDRRECTRILSDLLDVDGLANRITCELAEILFRFDCRQVYSLINQCDDCKEAYRRWVCSTLVPYFAEPKDVAPATGAGAGAASSAGKSKRSARSAARGEVASTATEANGIKHKSLKLISNNNKSNNGNNMNERQINQKHDKSSNARAKANAGQDNDRRSSSSSRSSSNSVEDAIGRDLAQTFYDVVGLSNSRHQGEEEILGVAMDDGNEPEPETEAEAQAESEEAEAEQQSNNFISTANNSDPRATDPVISKLHKRSTRKEEFRKRRRIRPCLSVCQTVEQKCPYLLPADRAPALPTQYAGEPTFLCLDQNIPETGAQLEKSSYGPNDCCYSYCNGPLSGICTVCHEFTAPTMSEEDASTATNSTRRVHNITLSLSSHPGEHARAKSVALALRNVSRTGGDPDAMQTLLDRLPYYARHDGVFYYDEEGDMPQAPLSGDCAAVPSVSSRCTIPYYASGTEAVAAPPTQLLVWLSALLGLLSSCGAARQRWSCQWSAMVGGHGSRVATGTGRGRQAVACEANCHEQELVRSGIRSHQQPVKPKAKPLKCAPGLSVAAARSWSWSYTYKMTCRKVRYFSSRSKFKGLTNYGGEGDARPSAVRVRVRVRVEEGGCIRTRNYRYFYYFNYNINDWWRRWWRCLSSGAL
ncbi:uro-adherence factor A [Drosophila kikkawai]|uniref:Uro-adherence factor A n=1 Tax=Drosophila kikkawai TaxID=30033 RepID=A0A6P4IMZ5_DROKI|nr:uncharacterized protein LOC108076465 [Drosophila kikkawai]XP_041632884.1 uncharacterized protein LOC108076465 [Drosophila kikkawai]XP_041632885.1 uncharacterized protein LOC108076465 [Drosophila kikkawai]XP_041632886.1 uncharacterized protein LOC108076465 [Drosophila kikkawai]XP_041632887.1 uncharacterized protein LOC108076465 [Drosophila kikkawai]